MKKILIDITKVETQYIDTSYVLETFANSDEEDFEIEDNYIHGYPQNPLMSIKDLQLLLQEYDDEIQRGEITHIEISHHDDHNEYEIGLFHLVVGTIKEPEPVDPIQEEIDALESRIKELKNRREEDKYEDLPF
jgi:hypothetical protein